MASGAERQRIVERLWQDGKLNRAVIAQGPQALIDVFELWPKSKGCKFVMVTETGTGKEYPLSGEKLSLVLTVYRAKDFADAKRIVRDILDYQGKGHSCGIHTKDADHARELAERHRRGARAGQPGAHLRQRRRLRQRPAVHAVDGLRHLAGQRASRRT